MKYEYLSQWGSKGLTVAHLSLIGFLLSPRNKKNSFSCRQSTPPKEVQSVDGAQIQNTSLNQWSLTVGCRIPEPIQHDTKSDPSSGWPCRASRIKSTCTLREKIELIVCQHGSEWWSCVSFLYWACPVHWTMWGWGTPLRQGWVHFRVYHLLLRL